MFNATAWEWLPPSIIFVPGAVLGVLLSLFFPVIWKGARYRFSLWSGLLTALAAGSLATLYSSNSLVIFAVATVAAYFGSRLLTSVLVDKLVFKLWPKILLPEDKPPPADSLQVNRIPFRNNWDARPRYGSDDDGEGLFVGREKVVERLTADFISKPSGTILISGVRGVGKTSLVDRSLLDARDELQKRYWKNALEALSAAPVWRPIQRRVLEVLDPESQNPFLSLLDRSIPKLTPAESYQRLAAEYAVRPARWFHRWSPTDRLIRRLHEASRSQLFVLKFNASDIGGAMADPNQKVVVGKPDVNPEKLLRALIRKLFMTCHSTRETVEAGILRWSLCNKKDRKQFFDTLQSAYDKSVTKSYKEVVNNRVDAALKRSESSLSERKFTVERIIGLIMSLAIGGIAALLGSKQGWIALHWLVVGGGATLIAGYFTWTRTSKRSRESLFNQAHQARFSFEYDYSLARMEYDLETILRVLREPRKAPFDRFRCFTRKVIVFDELDKLENPIKQLNNVITHFKNFFTLSDALFVFITDHEFYESLSERGATAQIKRLYSEEHTFFSQKLYLRKPDFEHFNETVYRFCDMQSLRTRVQTTALDLDLIEFLRQEVTDLFEALDGLPNSETLAYLYLRREKFSDKAQAAIKASFDSIGMKDPLSIARVWASLLADSTRANSPDLPELKTAFDKAGGNNHPLAVAYLWAATAGTAGAVWRRRFIRNAQGHHNPEAVAFLHSRRHRFSENEQKRINTYYVENVNVDDMKRLSGVDAVPFTISDLARALCFQTRNHYFDLYHLIYDYVGSYSDGVPVLHVGEDSFTREHRLWSRYQQMIQAAFQHHREDHPSREYYNAILMESLYRLFDTRGLGKPMKVGDVLFSPEITETPAPTNGAALQNTAGAAKSTKIKPAANAAKRKTSVAPKRTLAAITPRDAEQINQAILRLLRIAVARKSISINGINGDFEKAVKAANGKLERIANLTFTWEQDCEPVITQEGLDPEAHEAVLTKFWTDNRPRLEGLENELDKLWANFDIPKENRARKVKDVITRLRTTADGLLRRDITSISQFDAGKLQDEIDKPDTWVRTAMDCLLERIRTEADAEIADLSKDVWTAYSALNDQESRRTEIETMTKLPLRAIILPQNTDCLIYFVDGAMPPNADLKLEEIIPKNAAHVFWYASGFDPSEIASQAGPTATAETNISTRLRFYSQPPATDSLFKLLSDYGSFVAARRLQRLSVVSGADYKRAGLELIAPFFGLNEIIKILSEPALTPALQLLDELPVRFNANPTEFWKQYDIQLQNWSVEKATPKLVDGFTKGIASTSKQPADVSDELKTAITNVVTAGLSEDASKLRDASLFATSGPKNSRLVLQMLLEQFVRDRLATLNIKDSKFERQLIKEFVPWLLNALEAIASSRKVDLARISTLTSVLAAELAQQKNTIKAT